MTQTVPLTMQEIDDGWCLEEAPDPHEEEPYLELVIAEIPASGFEEAFWEQHEGRTLSRGFGEASPLFGRGPMARGTMPPPGAFGA
jgi:hypothetical protein